MLRNWRSFLSCVFRNIPHVITYHHFCFESKRRGKVFLKEFADSTGRTQVLHNPETEI